MYGRTAQECDAHCLLVLKHTSVSTRNHALRLVDRIIQLIVIVALFRI